MLLRPIVGGQVSLVEDDVPEYEEHDRSRVLSVAQDFVYCVSGGKKLTSKHVGHATILHEASLLKDLVLYTTKQGIA